MSFRLPTPEWPEGLGVAAPPWIGEVVPESCQPSATQVEEVLDRFRGVPPRVGAPHFEVQKVLDAIHVDPFDSELNVKRLKKRCHIRDNNISCRFRRVVGLAIKDYLERLRVQAACQLLTLEEVTVFDIALSVGYYHPQTFYNVFRRQLGCTPTHYRAQVCRHRAVASAG